MPEEKESEEKKSKEYSGPEKAAIFMMSLGEDSAAKILANLDEREIQFIGNYMSTLTDVDIRISIQPIHTHPCTH